ncbi:MAG: hypothetical protein K9J25_02565 [Bacteroidales bacterium]|nr:hypothetical protein [Bacteroidales bacterium]
MKKVNIITLLIPVILISAGACRQDRDFTAEIVAGKKDTSLFSEPFGMCADPEGNLYVADAGHDRIVKMTPGGRFTFITGADMSAGLFNYPSGVCSDDEGNIYVAGFASHDIRRISPGGEVSIIAGTGIEGYRDGEADSAMFSSPRGIAVDSRGNLYVGDCWNHRIRKITKDGRVSTFAGGGKTGVLVVNDWKDGRDTAARFDAPCGMAVDDDDNIYVADANNNCIRKITPDGNVVTLAGIAGKRESVDGSSSEAILNCPTELHVDDDGTVYFSDTYGDRVRKISANGYVSTLIRLDSMAYPRGITISDDYLYFITHHEGIIRKTKRLSDEATK